MLTLPGTVHTEGTKDVSVRKPSLWHRRVEFITFFFMKIHTKTFMDTNQY